MEEPGAEREAAPRLAAKKATRSRLAAIDAATTANAAAAHHQCPVIASHR